MEDTTVVANIQDGNSPAIISVLQPAPAETTANPTPTRIEEIEELSKEEINERIAAIKAAALDEEAKLLVVLKSLEDKAKAEIAVVAAAEKTFLEAHGVSIPIFVLQLLTACGVVFAIFALLCILKVI